jgi:glycosyltransferase involved in cell wall biosynthesis
LLRILIFARHLPPSISGGARRPYLLVKGLEELGADVRVIAPLLPDDIKGVAVPHPAPEPAASAAEGGFRFRNRVRDWARSTLILPDPDLRWSLQAAKAAEDMTDFRPDWVLSTSPPESLHVAARKYARRCGAKWGADLRDSWLADPLMAERRKPLRRWVERPLSRRVLNSAHLLIAPTQVILDEVGELAPGRPSLLLPQPGPDPALLKPRARSDDGIVILHTGSFSLSHDARGIGPALELFRKVHARDKRFRLELIGRLTDTEAREAQATEGVVVRGLFELQETWQEQASADILLLAAADLTEAEPGKLAEYRAMGKPIVCLGGGGWRRMLAGTDEDPADLLLSLAAEAARRDLADKQAGEIVTAVQAAQRLLDAMAESRLPR